MEQREQKSGLVLKYGKRRFDGGNEIELIRSIEKQKALKQLQDLEKQKLNEIQMDIGVQKPDAEAKSEEKPLSSLIEAKPLIRNRFWEVLLLGPLAICIGTVGMLTASVAILVFRHMNNEAMLEQSRQVLQDCCKTLKKGLLDSLTTPARLYKVCVASA